jgi:hypothetical protein
MREGIGFILPLTLRRKRKGPGMRRNTAGKIHQIQTVMNHKEDVRMCQKTMSQGEDVMMMMNQGESVMMMMNQGERVMMMMNQGESVMMMMNLGDGMMTMNLGEGGKVTMNREEGRKIWNQGEEGRMMRNLGEDDMMIVHVMIAWMLMIGRGDSVHHQTTIMRTQSMTVQTLGPKERRMGTKLEIPILNTVHALNKAQESRQGKKMNVAETMVLCSTVDGVASTICLKKKGCLACARCRLMLRFMRSRDGRG